MKKSIIVFSLISAFLPLFAHASIDFDLKYGSKGQEVTELQEFLIDKGFLKTEASGNFYSLTKTAVIAYQSSVEIPTTGFVGPITRGKINDELLANISPEEAQATPVVTTSPDVTALIAKLVELQAQLKTMQDAQNTTQAQTNQILGSIAQNTSAQNIVPNMVPIYGGTAMTPTPTPVPVEIQVLDIYRYGYSGNCFPATIGDINIKYSNGAIKPADGNTSIYLPDGTQGEMRDGSLVGGFNVKEPISTTTKFLLKNGELKAEVAASFEPLIVPEYNYVNRLRKLDDGTYVLQQTGQVYNPDTHVCGK